MSKYRNPFKLRFSERIESEIRFLKLFSPEVIDSLIELYKEEKLWQNIVFIHSSPGAGKTSLLRVFEPKSLNVLLNSKSAPEYKPLYNALKAIKVIEDDSISVLGIGLSCTRNYQLLEELNTSNAQKIRLFFSLLNSRIIQATLRAICDLNGLNISKHLDQITFDYENNNNHFRSLKTPCSGNDLYEWACNIERKIYSVIDSFMPDESIVIEGHDELFSVEVLNPETIRINDAPVCKRFLFMFDDAHKLTKTQRDNFKNYLVEKRGNVNIWIAERIEALDKEIQIGSKEERDFVILNLENFWRKEQKGFSKVLGTISDKRASESTENIASFKEFLSENLNEEKVNNILIRASKVISEEHQEISTYTNKFDSWISYSQKAEMSIYDRCVLLKEISILINRDNNKRQLALGFPFEVGELNEKRKGEIKRTAKLFLAMEYKLPYYFGYDILVKVASNNIEQYLSYASVFFEEMISKKLKDKEIVLTDENQHLIFKRESKAKWKKIEAEIPFGREIKKFLVELGDFCRKQTFQPNAPYAPGVTGFAIRESNIGSMFTRDSWVNDEKYAKLVNVISTAVAYNLLERVVIAQGKKGQLWNVFYLNRRICIHFNLPLSYGGWRHIKSSIVLNWILK